MGGGCGFSGTDVSIQPSREVEKPKRKTLPATLPTVDLPPPYNKSFGGYMWDMVGKPAIFLVAFYFVLRFDFVREQIGVVLKWLLQNL